MYARQSARPASGGSGSGHSSPRTGAKRPFSSSGSHPKFSSSRPPSRGGFSSGPRKSFGGNRRSGGGGGSGGRGGGRGGFRG